MRTKSFTCDAINAAVRKVVIDPEMPLQLDPILAGILTELVQAGVLEDLGDGRYRFVEPAN